MSGLVRFNPRKLKQLRACKGQRPHSKLNGSTPSIKRWTSPSVQPAAVGKWAVLNDAGHLARGAQCGAALSPPRNPRAAPSSCPLSAFDARAQAASNDIAAGSGDLMPSLRSFIFPENNALERSASVYRLESKRKRSSEKSELTEPVASPNDFACVYGWPFFFSFYFSLLLFFVVVLFFVISFSGRPRHWELWQASANARGLLTTRPS